METDPEVAEGSRLHYTTYFRQYDPRLGRWWSNDPVVQAGESPYAAMFNNPILFSDPMGNDPPGGDEGDRKELTLDPDDPWKVTFTLHVGESEYARIMNNRAQREQLEHERRVAEIVARNAAWYSEQVADYHRKLDAVDRGVVNHLKDAGNSIVDFGVGTAEQLWVGGLTHSWSIAGTALLGPLGTLPAAYNMPVPKFDGTLATPTEKLTGVVAFATTVGGGPISRATSAGMNRVVGFFLGRSAGAAESSIFSYGATQEAGALLRTGTTSATATAFEGFTAVETQIINEARAIMSSETMMTIRAAQQAGQSVEVQIGGRSILYEPGLPSSGFTLFSENGFVIGPQAFQSESELGQTVLQELFRLATSRSAQGMTQNLATEETINAFNFAAQAIKHVVSP